MNSDIFGGKIVINTSGKDPFRAEVEATIDLFTGYGFLVPNDVSGSTILTGIGGAFITSEFPPTQYIPDCGPQTQRYFGNEVRPQLAAAAEKGDTRALGIARQVGRLIGAAQARGQLTAEDPLPFDMGQVTDNQGELYADGLRRRYDVETGWVVDMGMGMVGLFNHLKNIKAQAYGVIGIQKTRGEQTALMGIAEQRGVSSDPEWLQIFAGGITKNTDELLEASGPNLIDVVVASRVHDAGRDLETGITRAGKLLRSGGLLIARGPRKYPDGTDYDKILRIVRQDPKLRIIAGRQFEKRAKRGPGMEANRVFLADAK